MKYNIAFITGTLLLSGLLIASSCNKSPAPEEKLPPETQTGAYTFGCKVDGVVYKATGKGGLLANQHMYYNFLSDSTFDIGVGSIIEKKFNINLSFKCSALNTPTLLSGSPFQATFHDNSNGTIPGNSNTYTTPMNIKDM